MKKTITRWVNVSKQDHVRMYEDQVLALAAALNAHPDWPVIQTLPVKIEIDVPEQKIEISESDFDYAADLVRGVQSTNMALDMLKNKLGFK